MPQTPLEHVAEPLLGVGQTRPQALQCAGLLCVFTQAFEQAVVPVGQLLMQRPFEQTWVELHLTLQPPQLFGSDLVAMQALPQRAYPSWQMKSHLPPAQVGVPNAGASQRLPQALQLFGSVSVATHKFPHLV